MFLLLIRLIGAKHYYKSESYFPEKVNHKPVFRIFIDQVIHIFKYKEINEYYFLYGFDIKNKNMTEYVPYFNFMNTRNKLNKLKNNDSISVLRNKVFFSIIVESFGFKTPKVLGVCKNDEIKLFGSEKSTNVLDFLLKNKSKSFFFKSIDGERGNGVFKLNTDKDGLFYINDILSDFKLIQNALDSDKFIIQEQIVQSMKMNSLFPNAINTIRLVTIKNGESIALLQPVLRVGTHDMVVDNWSQGGLCINIIDDDGTLDKFGYYKPGIGTKSDIHPNSNVIFSEFKIPNYREAVEQAKELHDLLPDIHSIGWDICISEEGVVFIEGNDNWAINIHQSMRGLKKEFNQLFTV